MGTPCDGLRGVPVKLARVGGRAEVSVARWLEGFLESLQKAKAFVPHVARSPPDFTLAVEGLPVCRSLSLVFAPHPPRASPTWAHRGQD